MNLTEENFEKPGEIHSEVGKDIEMSTTPFECTENLDLTKTLFPQLEAYYSE